MRLTTLISLIMLLGACSPAQESSATHSAATAMNSVGEGLIALEQHLFTNYRDGVLLNYRKLHELERTIDAGTIHTCKRAALSSRIRDRIDKAFSHTVRGHPWDNPLRGVIRPWATVFQKDRDHKVPWELMMIPPDADAQTEDARVWPYLYNFACEVGPQIAGQAEAFGLEQSTPIEMTESRSEWLDFLEVSDANQLLAESDALEDERKMLPYRQPAITLWKTLGVTPQMCKKVGIHPNATLFSRIWDNLPSPQDPSESQNRITETIRIQAAAARQVLIDLKASFAELESTLGGQCPTIHAFIPRNAETLEDVINAPSPTPEEFEASVQSRLDGRPPWEHLDSMCVAWYEGMINGLQKDAGDSSTWFGWIIQGIDRPIGRKEGSISVADALMDPSFNPTSTLQAGYRFLKRMAPCGINNLAIKHHDLIVQLDALADIPEDRRPLRQAALLEPTKYILKQLITIQPLLDYSESQCNTLPGLRCSNENNRRWMYNDAAQLVRVELLADRARFIETMKWVDMAMLLLVVHSVWTSPITHLGFSLFNVALSKTLQRIPSTAVLRVMLSMGETVASLRAAQMANSAFNFINLGLNALQGTARLLPYFSMSQDAWLRSERIRDTVYESAYFRWNSPSEAQEWARNIQAYGNHVSAQRESLGNRLGVLLSARAISYGTGVLLRNWQETNVYRQATSRWEQHSGNLRDTLQQAGEASFSSPAFAEVIGQAGENVDQLSSPGAYVMFWDAFSRIVNSLLKDPVGNIKKHLSFVRKTKKLGDAIEGGPQPKRCFTSNEDVLAEETGTPSSNENALRLILSGHLNLNLRTQAQDFLETLSQVPDRVETPIIVLIASNGQQSYAVTDRWLAKRASEYWTGSNPGSADQSRLLTHPCTDSSEAADSEGHWVITILRLSFSNDSLKSIEALPINLDDPAIHWENYALTADSKETFVEIATSEDEEAHELVRYLHQLGIPTPMPPETRY